MNEPVLVFASPLQEERPLLSQARRSCSIAVVAVSAPVSVACPSIARGFRRSKKENKKARQDVGLPERPLTEPGAIYSIY